MPELILLIPHYQNIDGLCRSLQSIDNSEMMDVLIVDDGSKISIDEEEISSFYKGTGTVYFLYLSTNQGIEIALNKGLEFILKKKYQYIARLDCGDVCVGRRFQKQHAFLEGNKEVVLVGSDVDFLDEQGRFLFHLSMPKKDADIRKKMYKSSMFIHPSIMFKTAILQTVGLYPTNYKSAEDYAFFFNVIHFFKVANMDEVLVRCELNPKGISSVHRKKQASNRIRIILANFYVGFYPIYGLIRAIILFATPLKTLNYIKRITKN